MLLARRNLAHDPVRFGLTLAGVAVSVALVLLLLGYRNGIDRQASAYLDHAPGPALVTEPGVTGFLGSSSFLPAWAADRVGAIPGVERVVPILAQFVVFEEHGRKDGFFLVGYDPARGGGPWSLAAGREPAAADELVMDATSARQHGISPGTRLTILDRTLSVVGLSEGTTFWAGSLAFASLETLESLLRAPGLRSFLVVAPSAGLPLEEVRSGVAALGLELLAREAMIASDRALLGRVYDAPVGLMAAIAFVVGVLVVGLVVHTATLERRREYGTLKAIGAGNGLLYRVVAAQALVASVLGALLGTLLAVVGAELLMAWRPQFLVAIEPPGVAGVAASALLMAALAALAPARSMARIEPAEVFRG